MSTNNCPRCQTPINTELMNGMCPGCLLAAAQPLSPPQHPTGFDNLSMEKIVELLPDFEILREIGRGGMGVVFEARQKNLGRIVALKVVEDSTGDAEFSVRFEREARAMAMLHHPNIVTIHDCGERTSADESTKIQYLTMEFVDGLNLRQLAVGAQLSPNEAMQLVPQLCNAIQYAHDQGVIHRDIKPENLSLIHI